MSGSGWRRGDPGFTFIELLIVLAILSILAAILILNFLRARVNAQVATAKSNMLNIATALETYYVDNQSYPNDVTLSVPVAGAHIRTSPATNVL